ncbi:MAG: hypothetical protein ACI3XN_04195 [Eubacteriales bacterium]
MSLKKNEIIEQVDFCVNLTNRLKEAVVVHEDHRASKKDCDYHAWVAEWGSGIVEKGASKTQIMASIVQLRRELNTLSRMFRD